MLTGVWSPPERCILWVVAACRQSLHSPTLSRRGTDGLATPHQCDSPRNCFARRPNRLVVNWCASSNNSPHRPSPNLSDLACNSSLLTCNFPEGQQSEQFPRSGFPLNVPDHHGILSILKCRSGCNIPGTVKGNTAALKIGYGNTSTKLILCGSEGTLVVRCGGRRHWSTSLIDSFFGNLLNHLDEGCLQRDVILCVYPFSQALSGTNTTRTASPRAPHPTQRHVPNRDGHVLRKQSYQLVQYALQTTARSPWLASPLLECPTVHPVATLARHASIAHSGCLGRRWQCRTARPERTVVCHHLAVDKNQSPPTKGLCNNTLTIGIGYSVRQILGIGAAMGP